uniref:Uncharacterized protein n=2 Tax=Phlebotomus papatasi TaxID=29031 RepID=A0A1B0D6A9_PHLPP
DGPTGPASDVSILVTEPSPDTPYISGDHLQADQTLVHVLVHRESEEYHTDAEDGGKPAQPSEPVRRKPPDLPPQDNLPLTAPSSSVTIMVESPKEPPK